MIPHAGQSSLQFAEPESFAGFADAMADPNRGWACTMRLEKVAQAPKIRSLFESDDEMEAMLASDATSDDVGRTKATQRFFRVPLIADMQRQLAGTPDAFVAQAVFDRQRRANVNVQSIQTLFVDVDCYNEGLAVDEAAKRIRDRFTDVGIEQPDLVSSGRGLYVKLPLAEAIPRSELHQWSEAQRGLGVLLSDVGSDKKVRDPARVLRVVGSINSKVDGPVRMLDRSSSTFKLAAVHERLAESGILRQSAARAARAKRTGRRMDDPIIASLAPATEVAESPRLWHTAPFSLDERDVVELHTPYARFAWAAIQDIERLIVLRGNVIGPGLRDLYVFWNLALLAASGMVTVASFYPEATALTARTSGLYDPITDGTLQSLYDRLCRQANGARNALYTPSRDRLMNDFEITPAEERDLTVLISSAEYERRRREARRATLSFSGLQPRESALLARVIGHLDALKRRGIAEPPSAAALAKRFDVAEKTARKYLRLAIHD